LGNGKRAVLSLQQRDETEKLRQCGRIMNYFNWITNPLTPNDPCRGRTAPLIS